MRIEDKVKNDYFEWMYDLMCEDRFAKTITYRRLFTFLHDTEFIYFIPHDDNRAADGISLRYPMFLKKIIHCGRLLLQCLNFDMRLLIS